MDAPLSYLTPIDLICSATATLSVAFVAFCSRRIGTEGNEGNKAHQVATIDEHLGATRFGLGPEAILPA